MSKRHQEHRQPIVFGYVPIGPGQAQAVVGGERPGAPGLGAVDDPPSVAAVGAGDDARQVRAAAGFGQQLHQHLIAAQRRRDVSAFLLFAAHVEDRCAANGERRDVEQQRGLIRQGLGVERLLVLVAQAEPAILPGKADSGESPILQASFAVHGPAARTSLIALQSAALAGSSRGMFAASQALARLRNSSTDSEVTGWPLIRASTLCWATVQHPLDGLYRSAP